MPRLKIAVVGSGISGLSCAWLLSEQHDITVFEADNRLGGHAHTVEVLVSSTETQHIDTGFIVFNERAYPNFTALLDHLNVARTTTNMSFAASLNNGRYEYCGNSFATLIGRWRQWLQPKQWRMVLDLVRFYRTAQKNVSSYDLDTSLADFLAAEGYGSRFIDRHILPMAGAIWSSSPQDMMKYPAQAFVRFFDNHGLLDLGKRPLWQTVVGGSKRYVDAFLSHGKFKTALAQPISCIARHGTHIEVTVADGQKQTYDHVVIATHADQALAMIAEPTADETSLLSVFKTRANVAVLHRNANYMPKGRRFWSAWNYLERGGLKGGMTVTYWMNALQNLVTGTNFFVTLNPVIDIPSQDVIGRYMYHHPVFNAETLQAQQKLWSLQGQQNTWFCGAWFGSGFHEDGLQAGLAVAESLGGVRRPWTVPNESGRIVITPLNTNRRPHAIAAE